MLLLINNNCRYSKQRDHGVVEFAVFVVEYTYHDAMMNKESIEFAENCNFDLVQIQMHQTFFILEYF